MGLRLWLGLGLGLGFGLGLQLGLGFGLGVSGSAPRSAAVPWRSSSGEAAASRRKVWCSRASLMGARQRKRPRKAAVLSCSGRG